MEMIILDCSSLPDLALPWLVRTLQSNLLPPPPDCTSNASCSNLSITRPLCRQSCVPTPKQTTSSDQFRGLNASQMVLDRQGIGGFAEGQRSQPFSRDVQNHISRQSNCMQRLSCHDLRLPCNKSRSQ